MEGYCGFGVAGLGSIGTSKPPMNKCGTPPTTSCLRMTVQVEMGFQIAMSGLVSERER